MIKIAVATLSLVTLTHDPQRPELNGWLKDLRSEKGGVCCSVADAVIDPDWESRDGHYRVKIDNEWWDVPDGAVLKQPNLSGHTMVWPSRISNLGAEVRIVIRCFMPGTMI